tara:strand:- start:89 stop:313 length:225 start_codon:yes stop_codon:yes gene_type:complete
MKFTRKQLEIMTKPQLRKLRKDLVAMLNNSTQSSESKNPVVKSTIDTIETSTNKNITNIDKQELEKILQRVNIK